MGLFNDMLKSDETLFKNELALDYEYLPKILPYREEQQKYIAACIRPLLAGKNGKSLFVYGAPGIGKTAATRFVLRDLENDTEEVVPIYINCWQKNTSFKIILEICNILGYKLAHNKRTEELFEIVKGILNKKSVVFAFDEVDKLEDLDFLYMILEEIYKKTVLLITNYKDWLINLEERLRSRLTAELLEFKPYNLEETKGILKHRCNYAFVPNVWEPNAFETVVKKTADLEDIRYGLNVMRTSANEAENKSSRKITPEHVEIALSRMDDFSVKKSGDLSDDERSILNIIKENSSKRIGEIYDLYKKADGKSAYKTFQRKVKKLQEGKFISVDKTEGGPEGNTTIVKFKDVEKKLSDF
ncbi:AAA family ATPase [Candidatus Woesearchaeota archaeon]|nr:AAA family ATPase [Candidatus Woesearchaeota archaeon]